MGTHVHSLGGVWVGPAWAVPLGYSEGVGAFTQSRGEPWGAVGSSGDAGNSQALTLSKGADVNQLQLVIPL